MDIILLESLNKLGKAGEIVKVKDGFAKNFLIPQKKAIIANKLNRSELNNRMSQINKNNEEKENEAISIKELLNGKTINFSMEANEDGNLYGAVNQKLIINEINNQLSVKISADNLILNQIKKTGMHEITIRLYDEISCKLNIDISKKN